MMYLRRIGCLTAAALLFAVTAPASRAEVAVRTDLDGNYRAVLAVPVDATADIWSVDRRSRAAARLSEPLNPNGASNGDLAPRVVETTQRPFHPWVVWSRPDAGEFDLVWSRWTDMGWQQIETVGDSLPGDDLDPDLVFDAGGIGYLAWSSQTEDGAAIMLRQATELGWTAPFRVSPAGLNGSRPRLQWGPYGTLAVDYDTDDGTVRQYVMLRDPDTITDDINPAYQFVLKGHPQSVASSDRDSGLGFDSQTRSGKSGTRN